MNPCLDGWDVNARDEDDTWGDLIGRHRRRGSSSGLVSGKGARA